MTFVPVPLPKAISELPASGSVWFAVGTRGLLARRVARDGPERWVLPSEADLRELGIPLDGAHLFGRWDKRDAFAVSLPDTTPLSVEGGWSILGLRALVDAFDDATFGVAGRASHVLDWATTSRFCGRCATPTVRVEHQWCMRCPACSLLVYPRIAPAVIVLVRKGPLALLARNARFPAPFFSALAGFSDVGETLEETLHREVLEEVGVRVGAPRYFGSQPWPFPNSLMVAFTAEWESGEISVDADEIAEARWFSADALPVIPSAISVARRMIDAWVAEIRRGA